VFDLKGVDLLILVILQVDRLSLFCYVHLVRIKLVRSFCIALSLVFISLPTYGQDLTEQAFLQVLTENSTALLGQAIDIGFLCFFKW